MVIGLYISDYDRLLNITKFLNEYFSQNCFIYNFISSSEIYEIPQKLDVLFLDITELSENEINKIDNEAEYSIIFLYGKTVYKPVLNDDSRIRLSIPLLFSKLNYKKALETVSQKSKNTEKLIHFKTKGKNECIYIPLDNILYIHGTQKSVLIYLYDAGIFEANEQIKELFKRLSDSRFLFVHNEYIINMEHVRTEKGSEFLMENNFSVPIRNYGRKEIVNNFFKYKMQKMKGRTN